MKILKWSDVNGLGEENRIQAFLSDSNDTYAILQLKNIPETDDLLFRNYSALQRNLIEPVMDHYDLVYVGKLQIQADQPAEHALENLYEQFNINHPIDYRGHSLSVSDVVLLRQKQEVTAYYVDSVGFQKLDDFYHENYLKTAEICMEDDYDMIDGVINNGPRTSDRKESVLKQLKDLKDKKMDFDLGGEQLL